MSGLLTLVLFQFYFCFCAFGLSGRSRLVRQYHNKDGDEVRLKTSSASDHFQKWFEEGAAVAQIEPYNRGYFFSPLNYVPYELDDVCKFEVNITDITTTLSIDKFPVDVNENLTVYFLCEGYCCGLNCCRHEQQMSEFLQFMTTFSALVPVFVILCAGCFLCGSALHKLLCNRINKLSRTSQTKLHEWKKKLGLVEDSDDDSDYY